jgi:hypothetical protein
MCGPSNQQKGLAGAEQAFSTQLQANYNRNFAAQSDILQNLTRMFTPIAEAGPDQQGFGPQELAALNTQAGEGVGANYGKAAQSLNTVLASRGGGNEVLPTGADAALRGSLASSAASELSQEELGITRANYAQGRQNWSQATAGLDALSGQYNPNAIAGEATGANASAFGEATKVQEMQNQKEQAIAGGIASLAMGAATFGAGAMGGGGIKGGLTALTGGGKG